MICKCGHFMSQVGGKFPHSPIQNHLCSCGLHNYNGKWFTKDEWTTWVEDVNTTSRETKNELQPTLGHPGPGR
jgi:hypothetical protein